MMLVMNKEGDYYHSNILDAIDEELEKDFDEKTAEVLRAQIASRLSEMLKNTSDDHSAFQKEMNQMCYPVMAAFQVIRQYDVPADDVKQFIIDIWDQIPEDQKNEEMWKALHDQSV